MASLGKQFRFSDGNSDEEEGSEPGDDSDDDEDVDIPAPNAFLEDNDNDSVNNNDSRPSSSTSILHGMGKGLFRRAADPVAPTVPPVADAEVINQQPIVDPATVVGAASASAATTTTIVFPLESTEIDEYRHLCICPFPFLSKKLRFVHLCHSTFNCTQLGTNCMGSRLH
jgi:hypothetical protein